MIGDLRPYPEYKDAGLPWLGRIPAHWEVCRNGRLFAQRNETGYGELPILEVSLRTGVRVRDMDDLKRKQVMSDREMYKRAVKGDIAYNMMRMWQGAVGVAPEDGLVSPAYVVARPYPESAPRYYSYLFRTDAYMQEVDGYSRGIVKDRNRLYWADFKRMPSCFPPPDEQKAIADYLDAHAVRVNRFIRNRRRLIEVLNEQKQAIINRSVTGSLDSKASVNPSGIDWLGDIPAHWETRRLRHVVRSPIKNGVGESAQQYKDDWPRYIRITDIAGPTRLRTDTLASLPPDIAANAVVEPGDLLFAAVGATFGKVYHHTHATSPSCFAGYLVRVSPNESISGEYLCYWAQSQFYWSQVRSQVIQATIQNFSASRYRDLWLPLPPLNEQNAIVSYLQAELTSLDGMIATAEKAVDLIRAYRTRLITDAVTGRVDVRGIALAEPHSPEETIDDDTGNKDEAAEDVPELVEEAADADD